MKDHSNPLSRPYAVRLAEQGFMYKVELPISTPYGFYDFDVWLKEHELKPKQDYVMSNWAYYFKDDKIAILFALTWL